MRSRESITQRQTEHRERNMPKLPDERLIYILLCVFRTHRSLQQASKGIRGRRQDSFSTAFCPYLFTEYSFGVFPQRFLCITSLPAFFCHLMLTLSTPSRHSEILHSGQTRQRTERRSGVFPQGGRGGNLSSENQREPFAYSATQPAY